MNMFRFWGIACLLSSSLALAQFNFGHQMEFGKNRVQFKPFYWQYINHEALKIYYYQGGFDLAKFVSVAAHREYAVLQKRLDFTGNGPLNILVFNTQSDFQQSNVGYSVSDQSNIGGTTRFIGDKIFVYSNGQLSDLERQIRYAIAYWMIQKILFTGTTGETYRNGTFLNIPPWFSEGLAYYLSEGYSEHAETIVYDAFKSNQFLKFMALPLHQSARISQLFWFYVSTYWGERMIGNILYLTKMTRRIEPAMMGSIGLTIPDLTRELQDFYQLKIYKSKDTSLQHLHLQSAPWKRYKSERLYYHPRQSPSSSQLAYVRNDRNQYRVYIFDTLTRKHQRIFKYGPKIERIAMLQYPLICWHPDGERLYMVYPKKGQLTIRTHNFKDQQSTERPLAGLIQAHALVFHPNGKYAIIAGVANARFESDLFKFTPSSGGIEPVTQDVWDDTDPEFSPDGKTLYFSSNRQLQSDGLVTDHYAADRMPSHYDVFSMLWNEKNKSITPVTETPDISELQPKATAQGVYFLSDKKGLRNVYYAVKDSALAYVDTTEHYRFFYNTKPITHFDRSIRAWDYNSVNAHAVFHSFINNHDAFFAYPLKSDVSINNESLYWTKTDKMITAVLPNKFPHALPESSVRESVSKLLSDTINTENYIFYSDTLKTKQNSADLIVPKSTILRNIEFPLSQNYYTTFYSDYMVNQFDNSFLANNYQVFSGYGNPLYLNPGFNILSKISISDLMENQRIIGGYRINPALDNEFMLSWEQRQNRCDHQWLLDRQTFNSITAYTSEQAPYAAKLITHTFRYSIKYPFSEVLSLRWSALFRNDVKIARSFGPITSAYPNTYENMLGTRMELVFDNTRSVDINILNGVRFKVFSEVWQYTDFWFTKTGASGNLFTSGVDFRHYQKIHRQFTWCNRFAFGNALGTERLIFYLGGVDNWYNPQFNSNVNIIKPEQYGFQTIATNLRGFSQNTRNGNNFMVMNSELRLPLVHYLFNQDFNSDFINYFQLIGFTDLGMAWYNWNPLSDENTKNTNVYIDQDPALGYGGSGIIIRVINYNNPLVGGIGFGLRSRFLGYFMRLDFGWGIDNWKLQKRMVGLSLTTDF